MVNALLTVATQQEPSVSFVTLLGIANVFIGLVCIIGLVRLMNAVTELAENRKSNQQTKTVTAAAPTQTVATASVAPIENKQEIIAAVCAAVAEENGTDISAIRVVSFKKL